MAAYYNEIEPYAAQWLENLIEYGIIPPGEVDTRDIKEVKPDDLKAYTQCHFFAGLGGWAYALRLAGWPDDKPVWTGSCPCQPFSEAGKRAGFRDDRHLWPVWYKLIRESRPPTVFGEQVASSDGLVWLDLVSADLEASDYAFGAVDLSAAGLGAPHIRQRLWFVGDASSERGWRYTRAVSGEEAQGKGEGGEFGDFTDLTDLTVTSGPAGIVEHSDLQRPQGRSLRSGAGAGQRPLRAPSADGGFWSNCDWIPCTDGKARPVEPGTQPLAHGVPARVGRLRAYGNAIVPQVAAEFIKAYLSLKS